MNTQDILNIFLIIILLVVTVCVAFSTYFFIKALKSIVSLADTLENTSQNIKEKLQMRALTAIPALLIAFVGKIIRKRG